MRSVMDDMMNEASTFVLRFKAIVIDYLTILYSAMPHTIGKAVDELTIIKKKSLLR